MEYVNFIKAKTHTIAARKSEKPVLSEEDEKFLSRITTEDGPAPLKDLWHHGDAQIALMQGAQDIPLPRETAEEFGREEGGTRVDASSVNGAGGKARRNWNWLLRDSRDRYHTGESLHDIAQGLKAPDAKPNEDHIVPDAEAKKEEREMTEILEQLNLAAVDNRVFSISKETQVLLERFTLVFKDLVNGVPTAYHDLESLLENGDRQLQKTYNSLPQFLQKLIEKLPQTMTKGLGPEIMAAAAERAGRAGVNVEHAGKAAGLAQKILKTPNLKDLVAKPSAIAGMLRSIIAFLRARFPAFMGMNVLWSLALFVLLFVFWYCHKRGREVRLQKERDLDEEEKLKLSVDEFADNPRATSSTMTTTTTTAPPGASMAQVKEGIVEAEAAHAAEGVQKTAGTTTATTATTVNTTPAASSS